MVDYEAGIRRVLLADPAVAGELGGADCPRIWSSQLPGDKTTWGPIAAVVTDDTVSWEFGSGHDRGGANEIPPIPSTTTGRLAITIVADSEVVGGRREAVMRVARIVRDSLLWAIEADPPGDDVPQTENLFRNGFQVSGLSRDGPVHDEDVKVWTLVLTVDFYADEPALGGN